MAPPASPALVVVLDGPAGAGKTSVARALAQRLGLPLLDTGAIYRVLAWAAHDQGISWQDEAGLARLCVGFPIKFGGLTPQSTAQVVMYGEYDLTADIRTSEISQGASKVSAHPAVRAALLQIQRDLGARGCVAEGRDMGTVVFPNADFKFFMTASLETRARRRCAESGCEVTPEALATVVREIEERDSRDSTRATAPLKRAPDAIAVDSSSMGLPAVIAHLMGIIEARADH